MANKKTAMLNNKSILITGGTGSFGQKFVEYIFEHDAPHEVVVFSRDEFKQFEMAKRFPPSKYPIRYFLGDIRDKERLMRAFNGIDFVVHAAALKQVPALEYNPTEAVKTNILGAKNIVEAALERSVKKVVALSTDKAVNPVNLYGATKLVMEKIVIAANALTRYRDVSFCAVRYGNVVGSRGSVIPFFVNLLKEGVRKMPVTDPRMTRFWITLDQGVKLVHKALAEAQGGDVLIPKIPSMKIVDIIAALPGHCTQKVVGIRPGEKLHETLIGEDEGRNAVDMGDYYIVLPQFEFETKRKARFTDSAKVPAGFAYRSDTNDRWLTIKDLQAILQSCGLTV
jgi:UDP-N-acetylglucosamine 4,6-dehydratase